MDISQPWGRGPMTLCSEEAGDKDGWLLGLRVPGDGDWFNADALPVLLGVPIHAWLPELESKKHIQVLKD